MVRPRAENIAFNKILELLCLPIPFEVVVPCNSIDGKCTLFPVGSQCFYHERIVHILALILVKFPAKQYRLPYVMVVPSLPITLRTFNNFKRVIFMTLTWDQIKECYDTLSGGPPRWQDIV